MIVLDRTKFKVHGFKTLLIWASKVIAKKEEMIVRSLILIVIAQVCSSYLKAQPTGDGIKPNWFRIFGGLFYVQTQNGFHNSLYNFMSYSGYDKKEIRGMITSFPKTYPALISLEDSVEAHKIRVQWVPVKNLF